MCLLQQYGKVELIQNTPHLKVIERKRLHLNNSQLSYVFITLNVKDYEFVTAWQCCYIKLIPPSNGLLMSSRVLVKKYHNQINYRFYS